MIDYRASAVALGVFRNALVTESVASPRLAAARDEQVAAMDKAQGMALLGALYQHLIWHSHSDESELLLVERAAALWQVGLDLYETLGSFRSALEAAMRNPADSAAAATFQMAMQKLVELQAAVSGKELEIAVLREDISAGEHPPLHPRQSDLRLERWPWSDILLARQTDALVRALWGRAATLEQKAFSVGALSSYGSQLCGAAYLSQVVGSPRRANGHRHRLARNTVGSWFARSNPNTPSLEAIRKQIHFGTFTAELPGDIETMLLDALRSTYDPALVPALPDLQLGYGRLLRHLRALSEFRLPKAPAMPIEPFLTQIFGATSGKPFSIVDAIATEQSNAKASGAGGSGVKPQNLPQSSAVGQQDSRQNTKLDCGAFFLGLFQFIGGTLLLWGPCWEEWAKGHDCKLWEGMKDDFSSWWNSLGGGRGAGVENTGSTSQQLTATSTPPQMVEIIHGLYDLHRHFQETLQSAYAFLSREGLIYPDALSSRTPYTQFISIPPAPSGGTPRARVLDSAEDAHRYPTTAVELPAVTPAPYAVGSAPGVFLSPSSGGDCASAVSLNIWRQVAAGEFDAQNFDLDADRGFRHPCWTTIGSIEDQPLNVVQLGYHEL